MPDALLTIIAQAAPAYSRAADPAVPWARLILAFLLCLILAAGAILWLRARQGAPTDLRALVDGIVGAGKAAPIPELEIEERLRVSPTGQLLRVRCGVRRYLVHIGPHGASLIDRLDDRADRTETGE